MRDGGGQLPKNASFASKVERDGLRKVREGGSDDRERKKVREHLLPAMSDRSGSIDVTSKWTLPSLSPVYLCFIKNNMTVCT